jgi:hypothetical protein
MPQSYEFTATRLYFMELPDTEPIWYHPAPPEALAEFDVMARRGARMLIPPPTGDLAKAWLEALWEEAIHGPVRVPSEIVGKDRSGRLTNLRGKIDRVFQASYALCRKFESEALQAEFEEKQRNDPNNWSPFRAEFEVFKKLRDMKSLPHEQVPEAFVRDAISRRLGIKPEEVTWAQIRHEVTSLLPYYPAITVIPSAPVPQTTNPPAISNDAQRRKRRRKRRRKSRRSNQEATIASQISQLRLECRWTEEKLAEKTGLDVRTVRRHLSGEAVPRLNNLAIYETAFSKELKRKVLVKRNAL